MTHPSDRAPLPEPWQPTLQGMARIIERNATAEDGTRLRPTTEEARAAAEQLLLELIRDRSYPRVGDAYGIRFVLQWGEDFGGPDILYASVWDENQWRPVAEVPCPPREHTEE